MPWMDAFQHARAVPMLGDVCVAIESPGSSRPLHIEVCCSMISSMFLDGCKGASLLRREIDACICALFACVVFPQTVRFGVLSWKKGTRRAGWVARGWELGPGVAGWVSRMGPKQSWLVVAAPRYTRRHKAPGPDRERPPKSDGPRHSER